MRSSESNEHKKLKEIVSDLIKNITGITLLEYQSSGHELDVYGVTLDGVSIYVEIIWSPSIHNFIRDMNLIQTSDAKIKLVVVNPNLLNNKEVIREFSKVSVSQRRLGFFFYGEMINGGKILENNQKEITNFIEIIKSLLDLTVKEEKTVSITDFQLPDIIHPENKKEELVSNLFLVKKLPKYIFISETYVNNKPEALNALGMVGLPFLIKKNELITFDDLTTTDTVFDPIVVGENIKKIPYNDFIQDENSRRDFINLLNLSLKLFLCGRKIRYIVDKKLYVCNLIDDKPQIFKWRSEKKYSTRIVAKPLIDEDTKEIFAYLHYASRLEFMSIDEDIYLRIEPTYYYTKDQEVEVSNKTRTKLNTAYLQVQFNDIYYDMVRFWAKYISKLSIKIILNSESQQVEVSALPSSVNIDRGYNDE